MGSRGAAQKPKHKGQMLGDAEKLSLNDFTAQILLWKGKEAYASIWRLIPVKAEDVSTPLQQSSETLDSGLPPSYSGDVSGQSSTQTQHTESERDDFGTIVIEVTTTNTVVTTRKKYRVEDA